MIVTKATVCLSGAPLGVLLYWQRKKVFITQTPRVFRQRQQGRGAAEGVT